MKSVKVNLIGNLGAAEPAKVCNVWEDNQLTVKVPVELFNTIQRMTGEKPKKVSYMVGILMLMRLFRHRREFPQKELCKALSVSHNIITAAINKMSEAGIIDVDKTKHAVNGWYYEYRIKVDIDGIKGPCVPYRYNLDGTVFADTLNIMRETMDADTYTVEREDPEWEGALPSWCYTSPYWKLSYSFMSDPKYDRAGRLYECDHGIRLLAKFDEAPEFKSGRIYHPFHFVPRVLRHNLMYEGSRLTELYDLHASFYTLVTALLKDKLSEREFNDLFYTCFEGRFYKELAEATGQNIDMTKELMQGWRNVLRLGTLHGGVYGKVSEYMETRFPEFTNIIYNWTRKVNSNGKEVKTLQQDLGEYETHVFSEFAKFLIDKYNITPFLLHDAVYCSQADKEKLPQDINTVMKEWFLNKLIVK
jgi:hypothetical protein